MKKFTGRLALFLLILCWLPLEAFAASALIPVGQVVGLELRQDCVSVAAFDPELGSAAEEAGLRAGDTLLSMNDRAIRSAEDVRQALEEADGIVRTRILREGVEKELTLRPRITEEGPRLGVYLRQGITGIGTVTWYDPETGQFGALGHGVNQSDGTLVDMTDGSAYSAKVISVRKGKIGKPGQLFGALTDQTPIGQLTTNCQQGIFGTNTAGWPGEALPIAAAEEVQTGTAQILSSVDENGPREYSVEILKIYPGSGDDGRNLLLKITDPALLDATGGIVQGMGVSYNKDNQWNP